MLRQARELGPPSDGVVGGLFFEFEAVRTAAVRVADGREKAFYKFCAAAGGPTRIDLCGNQNFARSC